MSTLGVAKIFDWVGGGAKRKSHAMTGIRNSQKVEFLWDRVTIEYKLRSQGLCVAYNHDFAEGGDLQTKVMKFSQNL